MAIGKPLKQRRPFYGSFKSLQTASCRRLADSEGASGGTQPPAFRNRKEDPDIIPIHKTAPIGDAGTYHLDTLQTAGCS